MHNKFLIVPDFDGHIEIPEEIEEFVKKALSKVDWKFKKRLTEVNEVLVGICKMNGSMLTVPLKQLGSQILGIREEVIESHIHFDRVFRYYVFCYQHEYDNLGIQETLIYHDYYYDKEELDVQRKKHGKAGSKELDVNEFVTLFYHQFNINKPSIKKFLKAVEELHIFSHSLLEQVERYSLLNLERASLKRMIQDIPALKSKDLTNFFQLMDNAMDDMCSGALNGFTPNEAKQMMKEEELENIKKEKRRVKQEHARLTEKDAKLFFKLYFGLLDFTNQQYKIVKGLKIYGRNGINPGQIIPIIDKLWKTKETIISEFCKKNPYKFKKEELEILETWKQGIRDTFIIATYEEEYAGLLRDQKLYMVKGLHSNIDEVIPYEQLPHIVITTIMPFKNCLIYDGIFSSHDVHFGVNFQKMISNEIENVIKYYHL